MIKTKFQKSVVFLFGLVFFVTADILASAAKGQIVSHPYSNLSYAGEDSSVQILKEIKTKKKRRKKTEFFSGSFTLADTYDDNILEYSSSDLNLLENDLKPTKFAIRTPDDFRTSFDLNIDLNPPFFHNNPTRLRVRYGADFFARNSVENYQSYGSDLKQNFWKRNYFQLGFRYIPHFYLRNFWFWDENLHRHIYVKASFSKQSLSFELGRRFLSRLALSLGYGYEKKDYNSNFDERDTKANLFYGDLNLGIGKRTDVKFGYTHKDSKAKGKDMAPLVEDISNKTNEFSIGLDFNLKKVLKSPFSFAPTFVYEHQEYTTNKILDKYHYQRKDNYYKISSELSYRWSKYITQYLRYSFEKNKSNLPETISTPDVADYKSNKISGGLTWFF